MNDSASPKFWDDLWHQGDTPWQKDQVTPLLHKIDKYFDLSKDKKIFVPLCGKSLDLLFFKNRGHHVTGIEYSKKACEDFFFENKLLFDLKGKTYFANNLKIINDDFFAIDPKQNEKFDFVFDRGALVALPPELREKYMQHINHFLNPEAQVLLLTIERYKTKAGPPWCISLDEVKKYSPQKRLEVLSEVEEERNFRSGYVKYIRRVIQLK